ncbi:hypothetical protein JQC92_21585 [Shewanella sp. 202IG2-18]|uniref:FlhC family transcriptional regulator n=1 Tax=Parashewanella hymeniacidonis TaxID=2807618 RepID=UPI00196128E5|nr:FlhC family transcriptional regulator [Parashewanella hymeniacidonis]MBM7074575.1 hypothetical protein [Parashewanella hymeniacidonis]
MNLLQKSSQTLRAAELIKYGFKTNIVVQDTGLSSNLIRTLYKEVQGESPKAGQLPSPASILSTIQSLAHASIVIENYIELVESDTVRVDINALIQANKLYQLILKKNRELELTKQLTINECWVLIRGLQAKQVKIHHCDNGHFYITTPRQRTLPICPFCQLHQH